MPAHAVGCVILGEEYLYWVWEIFCCKNKEYAGLLFVWKKTLSHPSRLLATNIALRNEPGEKKLGLCILCTPNWSMQGCAGPMMNCLSHQPIIVTISLGFKCWGGGGIFFIFVRILKSLIFGFGFISRTPSLSIREHAVQILPCSLT